LTKHIVNSFFLFCVALILFNKPVTAQTIRDSSGQAIAIPTTPDRKIDSVLKVHSPRKAAIRSAIVPGWGQAYNKKYWKIPIVYGALGTSAAVFAYNVRWYKRLRLAYIVVRDPNQTRLDEVHTSLKVHIEQGNENFLQTNRDEFRRNVDYSVIAFILLWGLNVVDATVDAHLKSFDVSPDLSFRIKPGYSDLANTHGVSLVLTFK
jgi:hypothetical protein